MAHSVDAAAGAVLSDDALAFVAGLHRTFAGERHDLLHARQKRHRGSAASARLDFLADTQRFGSVILAAACQEAEGDAPEGRWRVATELPIEVLFGDELADFLSTSAIERLARPD